MCTALHTWVAVGIELGNVVQGFTILEERLHSRAVSSLIRGTDAGLGAQALGFQGSSKLLQQQRALLRLPGGISCITQHAACGENAS